MPTRPSSPPQSYAEVKDDDRYQETAFITMEKRKFLEETNFADEIEEIKPEDWDAEASNKAIRAHQERIWSDANLRDGSY
jgi:hypothetical protein